MTSKTEKNLKPMKDDCRLFSSLYIACRARVGDLENLFAHENHSFPVSISEHGNLRKCSKSDFISCLTSIVEPRYEDPVVNGIVIDGVAMVHTRYPESSIKKFCEYCEVRVSKKIQALARNVARVDIVFNVYRDATLTQDTRDRRGIDDMLISIGRDTPI